MRTGTATCGNSGLRAAKVQGGTRTIFLASDTYSWTDTLEPNDGWYQQTSLLYTPDYPGGATNPTDPNSYGIDVVYSDSSVQWGASLQWLHDGYCLPGD